MSSTSVIRLHQITRMIFHSVFFGRCGTVSGGALLSLLLSVHILADFGRSPEGTPCICTCTWTAFQACFKRLRFRKSENFNLKLAFDMVERKVIKHEDP